MTTAPRLAVTLSRVLGLVVGVARASGQCAPEWTAYAGPWLDGPVYAAVAWDPDGPGPAPPVVVAGGNFHQAGTTSLLFVGAWDGIAWRTMGEGVGGTLFCATLFDPDGSGPIGPQPVVGGFFTYSGQTPVNRVARFDGSRWLPLDPALGLGPSGSLWNIDCIGTFDQSLVVGGTFQTAGGNPALHVARWDGANWLAFTQDLFAFDSFGVHNGSLYAGGGFTIPNKPRAGITRWTGEAWETVGPNYPDDEVFAIATYRGELIAGGDFYNCGSGIARYDGASWRPLGAGMNGPVLALCIFDPDGPGPMPELLFAGGAFTTAGGQPASCIAAWDGTGWSALGQGTAGEVRALTIWNNKLVVAGGFFSAGGLTSPGMAFWGCPQPPCYPNCDGSTGPQLLNVNDFVCFTQRFTAADPWANCDQSTEPQPLNVGDFVCFMQRFAAGCR